MIYHRPFCRLTLILLKKKKKTPTAGKVTSWSTEMFRTLDRILWISFHLPRFAFKCRCTGFHEAAFVQPWWACGLMFRWAQLTISFPIRSFFWGLSFCNCFIYVTFPPFLLSVFSFYPSFLASLPPLLLLSFFLPVLFPAFYVSGFPFLPWLFVFPFLFYTIFPFLFSSCVFMLILVLQYLLSVSQTG